MTPLDRGRSSIDKISQLQSSRVAAEFPSSNSALRGTSLNTFNASNISRCQQNVLALEGRSLSIGFSHAASKYGRWRLIEPEGEGHPPGTSAHLSFSFTEDLRCNAGVFSEGADEV
jgi:hypothetical protein